MLIEEIYNRIYAETDEITKDDREISKEIAPIIDGVVVEKLTQEEFIDLMCKVCAVGERRGFVSGFHVLAQLICEALS